MENINNNLLPIQTIKNNRFIEEVKKVVSEYYKIDKAHLSVKTNKRVVVLPRQVAMYFCRKFLVYATLKNIGKSFGKGHCTVSYVMKQIPDLAKFDKNFKAELDAIEAILYKRHNSIMLNNPIHKDEYFVDLNQCTSIKIGNEKSIVLAGLTDDETNELVKRLDLTEDKLVKHNNTGMYILIKDE
jgi:hypothetical protein